MGYKGSVQEVRRSMTKRRWVRRGAGDKTRGRVRSQKGEIMHIAYES